jgi:hypothetical protein
VIITFSKILYFLATIILKTLQNPYCQSSQQG